LGFCYGVSVASELVSAVNEIEIVHVRDEGISFFGWVLYTIYHADQVGALREIAILVQVSSSRSLGQFLFFFGEYGELLLEVGAGQLQTLHQVLLLGVDYALGHRLVFHHQVERVLERKLGRVIDVRVGSNDPRRSELLID
jgi:hypothetical protein